VKTESRKIPKLLGDAQRWSIDIDLGKGGGRIQLTYTNPALAKTDYERLKTQAAYGGYWIQGISYNEHSQA